MTYTDYLDGTSKAAVHALVVELEDAVRGASERAVAGSLDRIEGALRRLKEGDEVLRRDLEQAADRLPGQVQAMLTGAIAQAAAPQESRLGEVFSVVQRVDLALAGVSDQLRHQRQADEAVRAEMSAAVARLSELQAEQGPRLREELTRSLQEAGLMAVEGAVVGMAAAEAERFGRLSGWLGEVREALGQLGERQADLERARRGAAEQAVEVLSGRLSAMAGGMDEAIAQFRSLEAAQTRGFTEVRQAIEAIGAAQAERFDHLATEVGQLKEALATSQARGGFDQLREEAQTRHDATIRMLENINGRVIFDVEANNKAQLLLEKLKGQSRWQTRIALVLTVAVLLLFGYVFFGSAPHLIPSAHAF